MHTPLQEFGNFGHSSTCDKTPVSTSLHSRHSERFLLGFSTWPAEFAVYNALLLICKWKMLSFEKTTESLLSTQ